MKNFKKSVFLLALLSSSFINAQDSTKVYSKSPIKVALGNHVHVIGFLFENLFNPFNPHFSVETEYRLNKHQKHRLFVSSNLGFIRKKLIGNAITIRF